MFGTLKKFVFLVKKVCLLCYFNSYFEQKQKMEKMELFCSEAWVNPFGKMRFMGLTKIFVL